MIKDVIILSFRIGEDGIIAPGAGFVEGLGDEEAARANTTPFPYECLHDSSFWCSTKKIRSFRSLMNESIREARSR